MPKDSRKNKNFNLSCRDAGFTLLEVLVVAGISLVVATVVLTSSRRVGSAGSMERAANRFAHDVRTAQALALASATTSVFSAFPPCGFGVHVPDPATGDPNSYIIYAKIPSSTLVPCGVNLSVYSRQWKGEPECFDDATAKIPTPCPMANSVSTRTVKSFVLPEGGKVRFTPGAILDDIFFEPPDSTTFVLHADVGVSSTLPFTDFPLEFPDNTAILRQVRVSNSGRVEIRK